MSSQRKAIRGAVRQLLIDAATKAAGRVFSNRSEALHHAQQGGELPAILIHTASEDVPQLSAEAPREYERVFRMGVEAVVAKPDSAVVVDDELDDLLQEIETVLFDEQEVNRKAPDAKRAVYAATEFEWDAEGYQPIGQARMLFDVTYYTVAPEKGLEDSGPSGYGEFDKAGLDWDFVPVEGTPEAQDVVNLP